MKIHVLAVALLATLSSIPALATTPTVNPLLVNKTYDSGYSNGSALSAGTADTDFIITSAPSADGLTLPEYAVVAEDDPSPWYKATPQNPGEFISPVELQQDSKSPVSGDKPGFYDYEATLQEFAVGTFVTVSGDFAADNTAVLKLDDTTLIASGPSNPNSGYGSLTPFDYTFKITSSTVPSTLDFIVENYNYNDGDPTKISSSVVNPTGLFVTNLKITATPEPSTWVMMFAGLGLLLLAARLRRPGTL